MNNMNSYARSSTRRVVAAIVSLTFALGPLTPTALAQTVPPQLADLPIASKVAAKPNIMYTVDDSGSMTLSYIPDFVVGKFCKDPAGQTINVCSGIVWGRDLPMFVSDFNHMTYNPNVWYQPPFDAAGQQDLSPWFAKNAAATYKSQDTITSVGWTKVQPDPYLTPGTANVNMTALVAVPLYCNTDWPLDTTIGANGEYDPTKGAYCRINGTKYDALPVTGGMTSPATAVAGVEMGYNYPWQKTAAPDDPKYFYRTGFNRVLWCDKTNPNWPRAVTGCTYSCTLGGTPTGGTSTPQTCYLQSNTMGCNPTPGLRNYTPAACNATSTYCAPGVGGSGANTPGTGTVPAECIACTCNNDTVVGKTGACHTTGPAPGSGGSGAACTCAGAGCTLPACAAYVTNPTGCTVGTLITTCPAAASATCTQLLNGQPAGGTTLLNDANLTNGGTGAVCRHNNQAYGATPAGMFTYSAAHAVYKTAVNDATCGTVGNVSIPRHYYTVTSVNYCLSQDNTANAQWRGFGTGVCGPKNTFPALGPYPQYGAFTRVDLIASSAPFAYVDPDPNIGAQTRTYAQEITNYSNWYAYYRTRILAAKTVSAIAFNYLDSNYRVGFHTLNQPTTWFLNINDFLPGVGLQRANWYTKLFTLSPPAAAQTPTMDGLLRIGKLFEAGAGGTAGGLPALGSGNLPGTATDPITLSCQQNNHIFITDGFTNQPAIPAVVGNQDNTLPASFGTTSPAQIPPDHVFTQLVASAAWPKPYKEGGAMANTLSDIGTYFWVTDLRDPSNGWGAMISRNNVPAPSVKTGDPIEVDPTEDIAWWQHLTFSAISFGSEGILDAVNDDATIAALTAGTQSWPVPTPPNNPTNPAGNPGASAVDDLWHATVNSRGNFVYARDPVDVARGLSAILGRITNGTKARAGAALANPVLSASNDVVYEVKLEPGWAGNLLKVQIDPTTAAEVTTIWSARNTLDAQLLPAFSGDEPWFNKRKVVTVATTTGPVPPPVTKAMPFTVAKLTGTNEIATLASNATLQSHVIAYLRGGTTYTDGSGVVHTMEGTLRGQYRKRYARLGDISDSQAVIIDPPNAPFSNATDPGYPAFVAANASRPRVIAVGANDGMVHVFDDATGNELFGYIPSALFTTANDAQGSKLGIQALTFQDGGVPIFKHHFYVNSTARTADVKFDDGTWHTILVGGLGKGGNMYYALDLTNPVPTTEDDAASKVLWEFRDNSDMVYSYGRPIIAKTYAYGWVVMVTSSYNSISGKGKIYVLNPRNGALLETLITNAGSGANPSGLAQISGFTKDFHNQFVEQVYGGDLLGNLWQFDVSAPSSSAWTGSKSGGAPVSTPYALLTAPNGSPQPVTTAPQIEIDFANGIDRWVFVGTGRLLDPVDFTNPNPEQIESFWALKGGQVSAPKLAGLPFSRGGASVHVLTAAEKITGVPSGTTNGWLDDLPVGQRIVVDPEADLNIAAYNGTETQPDPCLLSLPANLYAREYATAESLITANGACVTGDCYHDDNGAVGMSLVSLLDNVGTTTSPVYRPVLRVVFTREVDAAITPVEVKVPGATAGFRFSWRLLGD
jgi:type IV pilus assembly protein PilY1